MGGIIREYLAFFYTGQTTNLHYIFFGLGIMLYLSIPYTVAQANIGLALPWPSYFYAATMIIFAL